MAQDTLSARPNFGRTFTTAMWLIGLLAAVQVAAIGWAVMSRPASSFQAAIGPGAPGDPAIGKTLPTTAGSDAAVLDSNAPSNSASTETGFPDNALAPPGSPVEEKFTALPPMPTLIDPDQAPPPRPSANPTLADSAGNSIIATGPAPAVVGDNPLPAPSFTSPDAPPPLSTALSLAALESPPEISIPDPEIGRLVDSGAEKRASGDMQGALDDLRRAESIMPDHPRILAEIAATYSGLGLDRKASLYWERVRDLGVISAGAWHSIAVGELTGQRGAPGTKAPPILQLGRVSAAHDQTITEGERVVLSVSVEADPNARPVAAEMEMLVYFYDLVDDEKTEASTADTSQNFISKPYNWLANGQETIEVVYHQPVFTEEQTRELGRRKYYGYIIELYYREELQDTAAFPLELESLDPSAPPSSLTEPAIGPDNSLFPSVPTDDDA